VTTAKLFAYAVGAAVLGVNTLEAIAAQAPTNTSELWAAIDAQRNQVFACQFSCQAGQWKPRNQTQLMDNVAWLGQLSPGQMITGQALLKLASQLPSGVVTADRKLWAPNAATVGKLAWQHYQSGRRDDLFTLAPQYFRASAAEEKRQTQSGAKK
jgi:tRNA threonylcarbamoyladenosine biosynthesis protein TsaB